MNNRKKILCVILAVAMVMSVFGIIPAGAEEFNVYTAPSGASVDERYPDFEFSSSWYDGVNITAYTGSAEAVVIPETIGGYKVVGISEYAFAYSPSVKTVTVPDTVEDMYWHCMGVIHSDDDYGKGTYIDDFTIVGSLFSAAMFYAKDNRYNFVVSEEPESIALGDTKSVGQKGVLKFTAEKDMNVRFDYSKDLAVNCTLYDSDFDRVQYGNYSRNVLCAHVTAGETYYLDLRLDHNTDVDHIDVTATETGEYEHTPFADGVTTAIEKYIGETPENLTIPEIIENYTVTTLAYYSFMDCTNLKSVTLPKTLKTISGSAFSGSSIEKIDIPNGVEEIYAYAFSDCSTLDEVKVPNSVKSIGQGAFRGTKWYNDQPDGAIYLGKVLYEYKGNNPTEISIKEGTKSITGSAFSKRSTADEALRKVTIPDTVTEIGSGVFTSCSALEEVKLSASLTRISDRMFAGCTSLKSFDIPYGIEEIGFDAFYNCTNLEYINIPDTVKTIGWNAFYLCPALKSVTIPRSVQSIDYNAFGYQKYGEKDDDFVIYGYKGTAAEEYATEHGFKFVSIEDKTDPETNVAFTVPDDVTMNVEEASTDKGAVAKAADNLSEGSKFIVAYDMSYLKDSFKAQPNAPVTVKIPCSAPDCKVYYIDDNGDLTDMNAQYEDGYLVFTTDHFSVYAVAQIGYMLGDVDSNGEVEAIDATFIQRHSIDTYVPISEKKLMDGDIDGDGEITALDATFIQRYTTSASTPFPIGEYVTR